MCSWAHSRLRGGENCVRERWEREWRNAILRHAVQYSTIGRCRILAITDRWHDTSHPFTSSIPLLLPLPTTILCQGLRYTAAPHHHASMMQCPHYCCPPHLPAVTPSYPTTRWRYPSPMMKWRMALVSNDEKMVLPCFYHVTVMSRASTTFAMLQWQGVQPLPFSPHPFCPITVVSRVPTTACHFCHIMTMIVHPLSTSAN